MKAIVTMLQGNHWLMCSDMVSLQETSVCWKEVRKHTHIIVMQGTHTARRSGIMAANAAFDALTSSAAALRQPVDLSSYAERMTQSSVYDELHQCRNIRPG